MKVVQRLKDVFKAAITSGKKYFMLEPSKKRIHMIKSQLLIYLNSGSY